MAEPTKVKVGTDETKYFADFLKDKKNHKLINNLKTSVEDLGNGSSNLTFSFLRVLEANATCSANFTFATCDVTKVVDETEGPVVVPTGFLFLDGYAVLDNFLNDTDPRVPENAMERRALKLLLQFLTSDHAVLTENRGKSEADSRAVQYAEHLMMPLVPRKSYLIDSVYSHLQLQNCCSSPHPENGKSGDTSFGCARGWHGSADIIIMDSDVPFSILDKHVDSDEPVNSDEFSEYSNSSVEVKNEETLRTSSLEQLIARTIVFSFLQNKRYKGMFKHSVIPGVGISADKLVVHMYDCVEDALLATCPLPLFLEKRLHIRTVLVLWLVLNYRLFCSGLTDRFKKYSANFHGKLGPEFLNIYRNEVVTPSHINIDENDDFPSLFNGYPIVKVKKSNLPEKKMVSVL